MNKYTLPPWVLDYEMFDDNLDCNIWNLNRTLKIAIVNPNYITGRMNALLVVNSPEMYELLKELEWLNNCCPVCEAKKSNNYHYEGCKLNNLIKRINE